MSVRTLRALAATSAAIAVISVGGCSASSTGTIPQGNPAAVARPSNTHSEPATGAIDPGQLYIPAITVNAPIISLPTQMSPDPFQGGKSVSSFGVPPDMARTAWWSDGPRIGSNDMAVVVGHSQIGGGVGVFDNLAKLKPGDEITIESPDGSQRITLHVSEVHPGISKRDPDALQQTLSAHPAAARLALVTCGGTADSTVRENDENVVVFASVSGRTCFEVPWLSL